jgi:hypothetical protein
MEGIKSVALGAHTPLGSAPLLALATFRTYQADDVALAVRTFGVIIQTADADPFDRDRARQYAHPDPPANCARGKVAVVWRQEQTSLAACYQVSDCRSQATITACGNTVAAALALESRISRRRNLSLQLELPGNFPLRIEGTVQSSATVSGRGPHYLVEPASQTVRQYWHNTPLALGETRVMERRCCVMCLSPLNNYLLVNTRPGEALADFVVSDAVELWREFHLDQDPLSSRMAVVQGAANGLPRVKFFTCGTREHPSAPLTGLAVLSLAARLLDWTWLKGGAVLTPMGPMALPRIHLQKNRAGQVHADIDFPAIVVDLQPWTMPTRLENTL